MLGELIFLLRSFHGFLASSGTIGAILAWLISFKPVLFAFLLLLLLLSNWLVKQENSWALSPPQEEAETTMAPEVHPNKEALEKMNACLALQNKVLERLLLSEMKLKALENQMFIIWNKLNRRRWNSGQRNFSRRRRRSRRNDSAFSTVSKCTTITPTECN
ncbi:testis-expressed protein 46 [Rattus norvegicus]|uniref:Testis expressed 46 n=2 Tax=Rattus norvegicus TaxID=10116 RepID=D4A3Q6_RAT|nr:testis-expressed protein 46 [Rattus norvegicus]QHI05889.1 testis-expressed protein 46 [Rattus norvegicus]|eukprot:XP_006239343.2 PREDICTED: uncharacterized protein C1orf234 homolog [Rattus norvegicus]